MNGVSTFPQLFHSQSNMRKKEVSSLADMSTLINGEKAIVDNILHTLGQAVILYYDAIYQDDRTLAVTTIKNCCSLLLNIEL